MKYTKRQIEEAVAYWEGQLRSESLRKANESLEYENLRDDVEGELASMDDIPNYLK